MEMTIGSVTPEQQAKYDAFESLAIDNVKRILGNVKAEFVGGTLFVETNNIGATQLMNYFGETYSPEHLAIHSIGDEIAIDFM